MFLVKKFTSRRKVLCFVNAAISHNRNVDYARNDVWDQSVQPKKLYQVRNLYNEGKNNFIFLKKKKYGKKWILTASSQCCKASF